jgi:SHS2 domain-containing protein
MAECMLNYMTDINLIEIDEQETLAVRVQGIHCYFFHLLTLFVFLVFSVGHDLDSLLYNYMNELLYKFISDSFCFKKVVITEFDPETFKLSAKL